MDSVRPKSVDAIPISDRWRLVRGADVPRHLRHLLVVMQFFQGLNDTLWCKRETMAEEIGITKDVVSQQMKELESLGVITRVWASRGGRTSREYAIQYATLRQIQRKPTLSESSECTLRESSECHPTLSESSGSLLANPQSQSEGILRHEDPCEHPIEHPERENAPAGKKKSKRARKAKPVADDPPSQDEWIALGLKYAASENLKTSESRLIESYLRYESVGWTTNSGGLLTSWKATCQSSVRKHNEWIQENDQRNTAHRPNSALGREQTNADSFAAVLGNGSGRVPQISLFNETNS